MSIYRRDGANGTSVVQSAPWGWYVKARLMCPDGKVRSTNRLSITADTFFSVPASIPVRVNGKNISVSGYMTTEDPEHTGEVTYKFIPFKYGKNYWVFGDGDEQVLT